VSRPRKPTQVLKLSGAFKRNPKREKEREGEPEVVEPLGEPPEQLNEAQSARWHEMAGWCSWLTVADRPMVEVVAKLWQAVRDGTASSPDLKTLVACLSHLGMTPVDRSKVKVPGKKPKPNKFGELAG
jgi:hypothetical protein